MSDLASVHITVYGRVQGVFFRAFVLERAQELGISGFVRNLPGGESVEIIAEGHRDKLKQLLAYAKTGPASAKLERIIVLWSVYKGTYTDFEIKR